MVIYRVSKENKSKLVTDKKFEDNTDDNFSLKGKIIYDYSKEIANYKVSIILTKERKKHILERHPEMEKYIPNLLEYINNPSNIISDKNNRNTKNVIKNIDENSFLFITVKFANKNDLFLTSIISARYQTKKK
ncbi:hypothetical protein HDR67_02305 [bacterium]|nr:hypothetical protein [bacterium]